MGRAIRVLIVEDEPGVAQTLARALELAPGGGYLVDICPCAEAALRKLTEQGCDIVLSDLELPGMDGAELLAQVHAMSPRTRAILMTARGEPRLPSLTGLAAEACLLKPFGLSDLLRVVHRLARGAGHDEPGRLQVEE